MSVKILTGDCRTLLKTLPAESVDCVVTSPPYWGLRDYGVEGQIGLETTFEAFIAEMVGVFRDVRRVLKREGTCWINLGDSYAANGGNGAQGTRGQRFDRRHTQENLRSRAGAYGLKPKDLVGIPWRVAFALQADGWWLRQDIIWSKPNPMPESVTDRCTKAHEYLFLLSKSERYFFDAEAISEAVVGDPDAPRNCWDTKDYLIPGQKPQKRTDRQKTKWPNGWEHKLGAHGTIHREGRTETRYVEAEASTSRNKRSVWTVATSPFPEAHFATFPPALVEPCILAGCPKGGTVLDPFGGAGTTGLVADRNGRNGILIELNPDYAAMAERRIRGDSPIFSSVERSEPDVQSAQFARASHPEAVQGRANGAERPS